MTVYVHMLLSLICLINIDGAIGHAKFFADPLAIAPLPDCKAVHKYQRDYNRVGDIHVEGNSVFSSSKILQFAKIKPKDLVEAEDFKLAIDRITEAYKNLGFIRAKVSIAHKTTALPTKQRYPIIDIVIAVDEGAQYVIRRIEFTGNEETSHSVLQKAAGLRLYEIYRPGKIDVWVRRLTRLGLFEKIRKEDLEVTVNDKEHFVDLLFHLKEKPRT